MSHIAGPASVRGVRYASSLPGDAIGRLAGVACRHAGTPGQRQPPGHARRLVHVPRVVLQPLPRRLAQRQRARLPGGGVTVPETPAAAEEAPEEAPRGHVRRAFGGTKALVRIAYRDPEHVPERLTLHATQNLAAPSREWAERALRERPEDTPAEIADELREQSVRIARVDGAVAGTPFFVALVPGYISYLWQEARMGLRTAALFGRDPASLQTAAEIPALRGVHPTAERAEEA